MRLLRPIGLLVWLAAPRLFAQTLDSTTLIALRWRNVGPSIFDGRVADIVGIPSPSKTFFVAAAAGGIWKTTNAGTTFRPVFDHERVVSMGALAIAPSDTNQVWAGTGEQNSRNTIEPGGGIYKSTDGGLTWKLMGLQETQHIGRIVVHPTNPDIVYVAALGHAWGPNPERGLYKTEDGGKTWKLSKFVSDKAGFVDVAMDPSDPNTLYATSYERVRGPYFLKSGGPGSALWKTTDGGSSWTELKGGGFPETSKGRINVAIARTKPSVVYAMVEADSLRGANHAVHAPASDSVGAHPKAAKAQRLLSGLYRSDDAGKTWRWMHDADTRPFYYSQVRVDTKNPDRVYFSSTPIMFSDDGGKTSRTAAGSVHVDHHAMWIDPNDPERFIVGNDGGIAQTWDRGGNYDYFTTFAIGQFYEVSYDFAFPYNICGGAQDNGSWCGPSRRKQGPVTNAYWLTFAGGDGFYTAQDPTDPHVVWGESQGGGMTRVNLETGERVGLREPGWRERNRELEDSIVVIRGDTTRPASGDVQARIDALRARQKVDSGANDIRFNWNTPFLLSPHNPRIFYAAGNRVLKSLNRGDSLFVISPDLSTQDREKIHVSEHTTGGITLDATGAETYGTVVALAESYVKPGWLYAGTDDGNVWATRNDGATWEALTGRFPGLPRNAYVTRIEPSHFDTNTFYVSFDNHRVNDFGVYLYVTTNGGRSFNSIASNLPTGGPDWVHVIREDMYNRDLLFVGTSVGVYASVDRGAHWTKFMTGLPTVPVFDLKIHPREHELIAATHGRSFWIAPIAPLEQLTAGPASPVHSTSSSLGTQQATLTPRLFKPSTAYQYGQGPSMAASGNGEAQRLFSVPSPAYGASIWYWLPSGITDSVHLIITDVSGDTLARLAGQNKGGMHTLTWDFSSAKRGAAKPLSPSEKRDSVRQFARMTFVLDSLRQAGTPDSTLKSLRESATSRGGFGGGRGGGGPAGAPAFNARPAEGPVPTGAAAGVGVGDFYSLLNTDKLGGTSFLGGRQGAFGGSVSSGDYLVTLVVGGKSEKQVLRVEKGGG